MSEVHNESFYLMQSCRSFNIHNVRIYSMTLMQQIFLNLIIILFDWNITLISFRCTYWLFRSQKYEARMHLMIISFSSSANKMHEPSSDELTLTLRFMRVSELNTWLAKMKLKLIIKNKITYDIWELHVTLQPHFIARFYGEIYLTKENFPLPTCIAKCTI